MLETWILDYYNSFWNHEYGIIVMQYGRLGYYYYLYNVTMGTGGLMSASVSSA